MAKKQDKVILLQRHEKVLFRNGDAPSELTEACVCEDLREVALLRIKAATKVFPHADVSFVSTWTVTEMDRKEALDAAEKINEPEIERERRECEQELRYMVAKLRRLVEEAAAPEELSNDTSDN